MELQLENLKYQDTAIQAVIKVFDGTEKNTFDNACTEGIRSNVCKLIASQLADNIKAIAKENGLDEETAKYSADNDLCIEMETGTGKTLVYIKTIYELYKHYAFTKFIILVPSIAIRQGTLGTFKTFEKQLATIYGFTVSAFDYDSKKLNKVTNFIEEQYPRVMIMTTGAFSSDDRILNRTQREDLFNNLPYIDAIAKVRPIIFMDEPQEGMDSDNMVERLKTLSAEERKERYSEKAGQSVWDYNKTEGTDHKFILIQIPEATDENSEAYKAGYKKISDITIERNKRVVGKLIEEKKKQQPDLFTNGHKADAINGLGFKVFKLVKSNFPRVEWAPDIEKTDEENIATLKKYIADKEAQLVTAFNRNELLTEILLKSGFQLNYKADKQDQFTKNEILLATDGLKETLICLDVAIDADTVEHFKKHTDKKFICLERALDTTKKYNLKHYLGDKFNVF